MGSTGLRPDGNVDKAPRLTHLIRAFHTSPHTRLRNVGAGNGDGLGLGAGGGLGGAEGGWGDRRTPAQIEKGSLNGARALSGRTQTAAIFRLCKT